jgi:hypothetical protein
MRGRQRIWDSEGKKEEKKGVMIISVFILFTSDTAELPN